MGTAEQKTPARAVILLCLVLPGLGAGCVRRTLTITTEPPNALVYLNHQEVGRSEVSTDFLWYGDYDVAIRKNGYETLKTNWRIDPPWWQVVPFDFFAEVLWPGKLHDHHRRLFVLKTAAVPTREELLDRAAQMRERAFESR